MKPPEFTREEGGWRVTWSPNYYYPEYPAKKSLLIRDGDCTWVHSSWGRMLPCILSAGHSGNHRHAAGYSFEENKYAWDAAKGGSP